MALDIDEVIAGAKLPERTLPLCLRGDLQAEWEDLERKLTAEQDSTDDESLAGNPKVRELADRMAAIGQEMADHEVVFRVRGLNAKAYSDLISKHRLPEDRREESPDGLDWTTYPAGLIAACAIDPVMTVEQAGKLSEAISDRQWDDLFQVAMAVNRSQVNIPFSLSASAIRASTEPSSKQPARGGSPEADSSDESLAG